MTRLLAALLLLAASTLRAETGAPEGEAILHLLDYVAVEYPGVVREGKVLDAGEYAEQAEFSAGVASRIAALPPNLRREALRRQAEALSAAVLAKAPPESVVGMAASLKDGLVTAYGLRVAPREAPDPSRGAALYAQLCVSCHGTEGRGDGPAAAALDPRPVNFHDAARQNRRSIHALYSTTTLGVEGTSMAAFQHLPDTDRWALAFHLSGLVFDDARRERGETAWRAGRGRNTFPSLAALATATPETARAAGGDEAVDVLAWLRANPGALAPAAASPLDSSLSALGESLEAYRAGDARRAYERAVAAYLEGVELEESRIDAVDGSLRPRIEAAMLALRGAIQQGAPVDTVERLQAAAADMVRDTRARLDGAKASPGAQFVSAFVIIAREGLEAILVLAGMSAFLRRTGRREGVRWLHGGWIAALGLGVLTWWVASRLIAVSGAQREVTEGVTALLASAVLLYVGFWLHSRSHGQRWNAFIKAQVNGALGKGTLWGLAVVSFLAVYREVFETVLFYQALVQQGNTGAVLAGFGAGCATLVAAALLIVRYSTRLPLGTFFTASSALLALMAVVFAGQGVAALQEAGRLPATPVPGPTIALLGIHPTLQGLALQCALLALVAVLYFINTRPRDPARPAAA